MKINKKIKKLAASLDMMALFYAICAALIILALLVSCVKKHSNLYLELKCDVYEMPLVGNSRMLCDQKVYAQIDADTIHILYNQTYLWFVKLPMTKHSQQLPLSTPQERHMFAINAYNELYHFALMNDKGHLFTLYIVNVKYKTPSYVFTNNPAYSSCH